MRNSILALIIFFVLGLLFLVLTLAAAPRHKQPEFEPIP
jgi:hypothetical protein